MPKFVEGDVVKVGDVEALMEVTATTGNLPKFASSGQMEDSGLAAAKAKYAAEANDFSTKNAAGAVPISGFCSVVGGTGIAGLTLAAPQPGCRCVVQILSLTSGTVVLTCANGVTVGTTLAATTTIMTFNAAADEIELIYGAANKWIIAKNTGEVALS